MTVYFVSTKGRNDGPVKIGVTADLDKRLSGLQTSHHEELEIIATVEGGAETEAYLHESLAEHRIRGEWYRRSPEVEAAIARARSTGAPALPLQEPRAAKKPKRRTAKSDVDEAKAVCRQIGSTLRANAGSAEQISAIHRKLVLIAPGVSLGRVKTLFYGEARRVDHFEMVALLHLRDRVLRIEEAKSAIEYTPLVAAALKQDVGRDLTSVELKFFARQMAGWRRLVAEDEQLIEIATAGAAR